MDAKPGQAALEHAQRMRRYCKLHHRKRLADFAEWPGDFTKHEVHGLVEQSRRVVAGLDDGWGSVDLEDVEYLAELDRFASAVGE